MGPRMAAREWFLDKPGNNKYDIEVHVQRSFWHSGFGEVFFRCTKADPPYECVGFWRGQELKFEWVPRQWLTLSMQEYDAGVVDGFSGVMHIEPSLRYTVVASVNSHNPDEVEPAKADSTAQERFVVEWRVRDVEDRLGELAEQAGVRDVQRM